MHPVEVANILVESGLKELHSEQDWQTLLQAAILHDVLEDTDCTAGDLEWTFNYPVANIVRELTDPPGVKGEAKRKSQVARMEKASFAARVIKVADKTSNLRDLIRIPPNWKPESFLGYSRTAYAVVKAADHRDIPASLKRAYWQAHTEFGAWCDEQEMEKRNHD